MGLILEELDVGVEEITLGDMDVLQTQLMDELEYTSGDGGFPDAGDGGEWPSGRFVFQNDTIELGNVELVGGGARWHRVGESVSGENGVCE